MIWSRVVSAIRRILRPLGSLLFPERNRVKCILAAGAATAAETNRRMDALISKYVPAPTEAGAQTPGGR